MCGAAAAFSAMPMSPQVVASVMVYFADLSIDIAGSFFQVCRLDLARRRASRTGPAPCWAAPRGSGLGALALALSSSFMTPVV